MKSPKEQFLDDATRVKAHRAMVQSDTFEDAVNMTRAQISTFNPSNLEMKGINFFIDQFVNLSVKDEERDNTIAAPRLIPWEEFTKPPEHK